MPVSWTGTQDDRIFGGELLIGSLTFHSICRREKTGSGDYKILNKEGIHEHTCRLGKYRPPAESEKNRLSLLVHEVIALGQQSHELRSDLDEDLLAGLFEYALIAAIKPFYLQPEAYDQDKSIQQSIDLFLNGKKYKFVADTLEESTHVQVLKAGSSFLPFKTAIS